MESVSSANPNSESPTITALPTNAPISTLPLGNVSPVSLATNSMSMASACLTTAAPSTVWSVHSVAQDLTTFKVFVDPDVSKTTIKESVFLADLGSNSIQTTNVLLKSPGVSLTTEINVHNARLD